MVTPGRRHRRIHDYGAAGCQALEGRVQVRIPSIPAMEPWARVPSLGGGSGRGFVWIPQIDDEVLVAENGGPAASYREEDGARVMQQAEIAVRIDLARGGAQATVWTCDFSYDYVKINADYRS